jgi:hypothetical protein
MRDPRQINDIPSQIILTGRKWKWVMIAVLAAAVLAGGAAVWSGSRPPHYAEKDVAREKPLEAAHGLPSNAHIYMDWNSQEQIPRMAIPAVYHDFGEIGTSQVVEWVFAVQNQGDTPLIIQRAYTTCDCTTAKFSSSVIPPGKISLVTLRFDPSLHGFPGATVRRGLIFDTNDPDHLQGEIWIQARIH